MELTVTMHQKQKGHDTHVSFKSENNNSKPKDEKEN